MTERIEVLDHGYVELVTKWGSEEEIISAARMSVQGGFVSWEPYVGHPKGDAGLLARLWKHGHTTPFEMAGLTFEVAAPIMVFREWHRHRVPFGYNEASARYSPLPDTNYVPTRERLMANSSGSNRQANRVEGAPELSNIQADGFRSELAEFYEMAEALYQRALHVGVPKELARLCLPVGRYSKMRATGNLRGWLGFLKLRQAPEAQYEIRVYADAIAKVIAEKFPRTWSLFQEGRS